MNIIHYSIRSFFTNEYYSIIRFASKQLFRVWKLREGSLTALLPGLGPHHAHQALDADAEAAVLIVAGLVRQDHALLQPGVVGVHPPRDAARALDILCFSFATEKSLSSLFFK